MRRVGFLLAFLMTVPVHAGITPGFTLNFEAGNETTGDNSWQTTTATPGFNWSFPGPRTPTAAPIVMPGFDQVYNFPADRATTPSYNSLGSGSDATWEVWFQPADLADTHVLFKAGGNGSGTSLVLDGSSLVFTAQTNNSIRMQTATPLAASNLNHINQVIGTIDFLGGGAGQVDLYLNGQHVGSDTIAAGFTSWVGGAGSGLGRENGTVAGDNSFSGALTDYTGQIPVNRSYIGTALTADQVKDNFEAVAGVHVGIELDGLTLNWDAADPGPSPASQWQANIHPGGETINWSLAGGANAPSLAAINPAGSTLTAAYDFKGAGSAQGSAVLDGFSGNPTDEDASFEFWFKPSDLSGREAVLDIGGMGAGTTFAMDGDTLWFVAQNSPSNRLETSYTFDPAEIHEFVQVVGTIDVGGNASDLYVNGILRDSDGGVTLSDWAGPNGDAIGSIRSNIPDVNGLDYTNFGTFDGQIALARYYRNTVLTSDQVWGNFTTLWTPEPGSALLLVLGAIGLAAIRRRRPLNPNYSWPHTNPKRKRGRGNNLSSLALRVSVEHTALESLGRE